MMNINFLACVDIMQQSINRMIKHNLGTIVNISTKSTVLVIPSAS